MADSGAIDRWLQDYEASWASGEHVRALFTPDARYFTAPYRPPLIGSGAIEKWWIAQGESGSRWNFEREVIARDNSLYVVRGTTTYLDALGPDGEPEVYHNLWLITLAENGRASEFIEYWMLAE